MLQINNHILSISHAGNTIEQSLPALAVNATVRVWAVPVAYRGDGVFVSVTQHGQPQEVPACNPSDASLLGELELPAAEDAQLAQARAVAHARIEQWRDAQENATISFDHAGTTWDGGLATRSRLQPVVALESLPDGFFWTDRSNNDVPMTLQELQTLNAAHEHAIVVRGFEIHGTQRSLKGALQTLTLDELQSFDPGAAATL